MSDNERPDPETQPDQPDGVVDHEQLIALANQRSGAEDTGAAPRDMRKGIRGTNPWYIILPVLAVIAVVALSLALHGNSTQQGKRQLASDQQQALAGNQLSGSNSGVGQSPYGDTTQQHSSCQPNYHVESFQGQSMCVLNGHTLGANPSASPKPTPTANPCPPGYAPQVVNQQMACVPQQGATPAPRAGGGAGATPPRPVATPTPSSVVNLSDDAQTRADVAARNGTSSGNGGGAGGGGGQQPTAQPNPTPQGSQSVLAGSSNQNSASSQNEQYIANSSQRVGYRPLLTEDQLGIGTMIPYALQTCINSDQPGTFLLRTTGPVFDSRTHRYVAVPTGTLVAGSYNSHLTQDQTGILGVVTGFRFQNGDEFDFPGEVVANDQGETGLYGDVNRHVGQLYTSALLMTALGAASAALQPQTQSILTTPTIGSQIGSAAGGQLSNLGTQIIGHAFGRAPTIVVCPPYTGVITVMHDLPLNRYLVGGNQGEQSVEYRVAPIGTVQSQFVQPRGNQRYYPIVVPTPAATPMPTPAPTPTRDGVLDMPTYPPSPHPRDHARGRRAA